MGCHPHRGMLVLPSWQPNQAKTTLTRQEKIVSNLKINTRNLTYTGKPRGPIDNFCCGKLCSIEPITRMLVSVSARRLPRPNFIFWPSLLGSEGETDKCQGVYLPSDGMARLIYRCTMLIGRWIKLPYPITTLHYFL